MSLISRVSNLLSSFDLDELRSQGYSLKQDRPPFQKYVDKSLEPKVQMSFAWSASRPSIVFVDNNESCLLSVIEECKLLPQFSSYNLVGIYVPTSTDPDKVIALATEFANLVVLDGGQYIDKNCPECNQAEINAAKLRSRGVTAHVTVADPREEYCSVGMLATAMSIIE